MRTRSTVIAIILLAFLLPEAAIGFETNQYDLAPQPLADIGAEVTDHVARKLRIAVDKLNGEILEKEKCLTAGSAHQMSGECNGTEAKRLEYLRSEDALAQAAFDQLGAGVPPFTSMGTWMDSHHFAAHPARYRTSYVKSIFILNPGVALTISPTVKLYGSEFGTDKVAHVFQQGYTYYKAYRRALAEGATPFAATEKAIRWGQKSERTFYGTLVAGVYSNGDLAANYAGLKFYQGLTQPFVIGGNTRPALLALHEGTWRFRNDAEGILLKPFISDHFNEALNPSIFSKLLGWRWFIRRSVKKRSCEQWRQRYPELSRSALEERSQGLRLWHDEDYGFTDSEDFVTIANTCFE